MTCYRGRPIPQMQATPNVDLWRMMSGGPGFFGKYVVNPIGHSETYLKGSLWGCAFILYNVPWISVVPQRLKQ
jgi:hypothetical protein